MALLLSIDTALEKAFIGLFDGNKELASAVNDDTKNHAAFVQKAVQTVMRSAAVSFGQIDAVAVANGPGSYTGLRVGLASAKGICYAAGKPLLLVGTLEVMARAAVKHFGEEAALYCPVIDARRNEVFAAIYDYYLRPLIYPQPIIVEKNSFQPWLDKKKLFFLGSGHNKCENIITHPNAVFTNISYSPDHTNEIAQRLFAQQLFADVAYAEPYYTKEFYFPVK